MNNLQKEIKEIEKRIRKDQELLLKKQQEWEEQKDYIDIPFLTMHNKSDIQKTFNITQEQANDVFIESMDKYVRYWFKDKKMEIVTVESDDNGQI